MTLRLLTYNFQIKLFKNALRKFTLQTIGKLRIDCQYCSCSKFCRFFLDRLCLEAKITLII